MTDPLEGYSKGTFTAEGKTRDVFRTGRGPAVIVIAEIPGITPAVADFGRRVAEIGCTAVLPSLFGVPGKPPSTVAALQSIGPACVSREFSCWALRRTSPVTTWLRALAKQAHEECGGPGVGAVGMCFTGGFALGMMVDDVMLAPVLSQPSLPFPITRAHRRDVGVSDEDLAAVRRRASEDGVCLLGLRYQADVMSPADRFQRLRDELGDKFIAVEIPPADNPPSVKHPHSVLTEHRHEPSVHQVLDFFRDRLLKS
jgi:dienelactone hydrolase